MTKTGKCFKEEKKQAYNFLYFFLCILRDAPAASLSKSTSKFPTHFFTIFYYNSAMKKITIPNFGTLDLAHVVLDYNGTIAVDGELLKDAKDLIKELSSEYSVHVITADTFGSVAQAVAELGVTLHILQSNSHTEEKARYIQKLGASSCVAVGNGNNDAAMLCEAALGIAVIGSEGCAKNAMMSADLICNGIEDALSVLLKPKRLIATLRK